MFQKNSTMNYCFRNLHNVFEKYGGFAFESASSLVHCHKDFYELILITEGKWQHTINDVTTSLLPGTLCLFKPEVTHLLFTDSSESRHFVFCVEKSFFEKFVERVYPDFHLNSFTHYLEHPVSSEKMRYLIYLGKSLSRNPKLARNIGDELLMLCLSEFAHLKDTQDYSAYVTDIIQKLNNHIYLNTSVADICAHYPHSQAVLLSQFKKTTGMTIVQYKAKQKMIYACQLLSQTQLSLIEISSFLQYDSLSYFMNSFKKIYGVTPTEYRKTHFIEKD